MRTAPCVCVDCRRVWRIGAACPSCGQPGQTVSVRWRPPRRHDDLGWARIAAGEWLWDRRAVQRAAGRLPKRLPRPRMLAGRTSAFEQLGVERVFSGARGVLTLSWPVGFDLTTDPDALAGLIFRTPGRFRIYLDRAPSDVLESVAAQLDSYPRHEVLARRSSIERYVMLRPSRTH